MRLLDFQPHWIGPMNWSSPAPYYIGVSFLCPHCPKDAPEHGPERRRRLAVSFWPHIDPTEVAKMFAVPWPDTGGHRRVSGETFDTLSLSPSVGFESIGHWHGWLTNGELI